MTDEEFHTLATLYLEDAIEPADLVRLNRELSASADRVREFNDLRLLMGLIHEHGSPGDDIENVFEISSNSSNPSSHRAPQRLTWHPLTSAAVGIIAGLLTTTIMWAYTGPKIPEISRIPLALVDPGFEHLATPLAKYNSLATGQWTGSPTLVVTARGASAEPHEGRAMVQMLSDESRRFSNIQQVVEVGHLISPQGCAMELSAALFCDGSARKSRFRMRVRAYTERANELQANSENLLEFPIADLLRGFHVPPESTQWTIGKLKIDLPPETQTLLINIHAIDPPRKSGAAQYIDDVQAALLVTDLPADSK